MATRRIQKELKELNSEMSDHQNIIYSIAPTDGNLFTWAGYMFGPTETPYEGGIFRLIIDFPPEYPFKPPKISFRTKIYHPNISETGMICLDILKNAWSPALSIGKVMLSLSSLLSDPNPNDPLAPEVAMVYKTNKKLYEETAKKWTVKYAQQL